MLQINLASMVRKRRARPPKALTLVQIQPTVAHETDLRLIYLRVVRAWWEAARDQIMPAYRRALEIAASRQPGPVLDDANELGDLTGSVDDQVSRLILQLTPDLQAWAIRVEAWHRGKWSTSLTPTGIDASTLLGPEDVGQTIEAVVQQNVSLIRSVSDEERNRIAGIILRGFTARVSSQEIARQISAAVGMSRRRAILIAADQNVKLSSDLDTARMEQAGISEFEWVHSGKPHYRPWHRARNGLRFPLRGVIPPDDMPGIPVNCGCRKKAVLSLDE